MNVEKQVHYGQEVTVNTDTEPLRKSECLCLNGCRWFRPGQADHCGHADALFQTCIAGGIALMVTRCALYEPKAE